MIKMISHVRLWFLFRKWEKEHNQLDKIMKRAINKALNKVFKDETVFIALDKSDDSLERI